MTFAETHWRPFFALANVLALGAAASSAPLLFANQIPCWALADASQADGAVAAPPWMLQHLNLAEGDAVSLASS